MKVKQYGMVYLRYKECGVFDHTVRRWHDAFSSPRDVCNKTEIWWRIGRRIEGPD